MLDISRYVFLIGLNVKAANRIGGMVFAVRATQGPDGPYIVTRDYRVDRINVEVDDNGKITRLIDVG